VRASLRAMHRRFALLLALAASAALLGGCVVITGPVVAPQQDVVGKLRLTFNVCASGFDNGDDVDPEEEDHPGCFDDGNANLNAFSSSDQLLLGIRAPVGTGAPATIVANPAPTPPASGAVVLRRSASYEAALAASLPPAAGLRWIGYMSDPYDFDDGGDDVPAQSAQVAVDLALPATADGGPFVGPLAVRPVVGARIASGTFPAGRPVQCGPSAFVRNDDDATICVDSPTSGLAGTSINFPTRDFGVVGGKATASPGQTVTLPFGVRGAGALPAGLTATLAAATTLPGVSVAPSQASAPLSNGSNTRVTVPVAIPKNAGPGTFDITLTGRLANGQTRTGVAKLTVRDRQAPVLSALKAKPKRFRAATRKRPRRGTTVSFALSEPATVRVVVERCSKRARNRRTGKRTGRCVRFKAMRGAFSKPGVKGANSFRFKGRLRGKALKSGAYRLKVTPTDAAANRGKAVRARFAVRR
jgi:hypothetical protein